MSFVEGNTNCRLGHPFSNGRLMLPVKSNANSGFFCWAGGQTCFIIKPRSTNDASGGTDRAVHSSLLWMHVIVLCNLAQASTAVHRFRLDGIDRFCSCSATVVTYVAWAFRRIYMTISRKASDTTLGAPESLAFVCSNTVNIYRCMGVIDLGWQCSALFV